MGTESFYFGKCPDFGGNLITTGEDYERFLAGLLGYKTLSKAIVDASEEDSTPFLGDFYTLYGDYGFGHFLMCFDSVHGFTDKCRQDMCHMRSRLQGRTRSAASPSTLLWRSSPILMRFWA